jgi:hypothetical protein
MESQDGAELNLKSEVLYRNASLTGDLTGSNAYPVVSGQHNPLID